VKCLCAAAGLSVREDAVGNTFARWAGESPELGAIGTGSHIDAIPNAGRYDGTVGVLGGLEAIRSLKAAGFRPRRSLELLIFTAEEPTRFGLGCLGSRLLAGTLSTDVDGRLLDRDGRTLGEVRTAAGFSGDLGTVALKPGHYAAFIELHIEQGPLLEREGIRLGVVTAIAAPASLRVTIEGEGGHAGAVLMPDRHDAFLAAAEIALALESAVKATGAIDTVGTCGVCDVFPGAVNSVPSRVRLELDIRDIDRARRDSVIDAVSRAAGQACHKRGVRLGWETINADDPAICDAKIIQALTASAEAHSLAYRKMVSRAYHDSLFMSRVAPAGMLFIPCRLGYSHRPDEYASLEDIAAGAQVLAEAMARLSCEDAAAR
jgi:N-carbamoyl-L-amino-acid hydrolase